MALVSHFVNQQWLLLNVNGEIYSRFASIVLQAPRMFSIRCERDFRELVINLRNAENSLAFPRWETVKIGARRNAKCKIFLYFCAQNKIYVAVFRSEQ